MKTTMWAVCGQSPHRNVKRSAGGSTHGRAARGTCIDERILVGGTDPYPRGCSTRTDATATQWRSRYPEDPNASGGTSKIRHTSSVDSRNQCFIRVFCSTCTRVRSDVQDPQGTKRGTNAKPRGSSDPLLAGGGVCLLDSADETALYGRSAGVVEEAKSSNCNRNN